MSVTKGLRLAPLLVLVACGGNPAPSGFAPAPEEAVRDVYGGWIAVTIPVGRRETTLSGELLAARADSLWILPDTGRGAVAVATSAVQSGQLVAYRSDGGKVAALTALGMLSTISNGAFLLLTAPAWLITGLVAGSSEYSAQLRKVPRLAWADLAAYARFPAGLPAGIDLAEIRPKPAAKRPAAGNP